MPQFGGAAEKCAVCSKTVYLAEKIVVEDKEDKKTFHKTCLKCSHCKVTLTLGNYASMNGVFYCKPHFKQLFATKGNYDEGFGKDKHTKNWTPQTVSSGPASFVPVDKDEGQTGSNSNSKKETPNSIASKFGRTTLNTEKCHVCNKTVYATEKTVIEEKEGKKVFHKTCLKCSHCSVIVTLGNYASMQGVVYCKPHFKQLFAAKGNYDEGFGKEKASSKWEPQASSAPTTFVPVDKDDGHKEKRSAPEGIASPASRFKGTASNTEKCQSCGKTVYATERVVVEDKEDKQTFHKTCLKCSHCSVILNLGNYASMNGVMYCKPHFKQLFAAKGNYDEGFGKEKHTKKWDKEGEEEGSGSATTSTKEHEAHEHVQKHKEVEKEEEEEDPQELEREIEAEKKQQREREEERQRQEEEREERERQEERDAEEREQKRREQRAQAEREEREKEEREEQEREQAEAEERKRLEEELEQGHKEQNIDDEEEAHSHAHSHDHDHSHDHHDHDHEHSHDHDHEHDHHDHEHSHDHDHHDHEHSHEHSHDHDHEHDHHDHEHSHDEHDHEHSHEHDQEHEHEKEPEPEPEHEHEHEHETEPEPEKEPEHEKEPEEDKQDDE